MLETESASLDSFRGPLQQFLDENDIAQVIVTVLGMLPTLLDLKAYDATSRICGWISSTPWGKSAQLSEAMRRLDGHVDAATAAEASAAGARMNLEQVVELLQTTVAQLQAR
jgi:hypothetical protein